MGWNTPRTWSPNEVLTYQNMNTYVSNDLAWLVNDRPRASLSATVNVASGSSFSTPTFGGSASSSWTAASSAAGSIHSTSSMFFTATVSTAGPGFYLCTANVIFSTDSVGKRGVCLSESAAGAGTIYAQDLREPVAGGTATAINVVALVPLSAGGKIHLGIRQSSGSSMLCAVRFACMWMSL